MYRLTKIRFISVSLIALAVLSSTEAKVWFKIDVSIVEKVIDLRKLDPNSIPKTVQMPSYSVNRMKKSQVRDFLDAIKTSNFTKLHSFSALNKPAKDSNDPEKDESFKKVGETVAYLVVDSTGTQSFYVNCSNDRNLALASTKALQEQLVAPIPSGIYEINCIVFKKKDHNFYHYKIK